MNSYSAPRARLRVVKSARDPPNPLQPFPVPFRPPASACGARFFSFFTANTSKKSPFFSANLPFSTSTHTRTTGPSQGRGGRGGRVRRRPQSRAKRAESRVWAVATLGCLARSRQLRAPELGPSCVCARQARHRAVGDAADECGGVPKVAQNGQNREFGR